MNTPITSTTQLCDLLDYANQLAQDKADYKGKPAEFLFMDDGRLTSKPAQGVLFGASMQPVTLTDHALKQAFNKLGKAYGLNSLGTDHMKALSQVEPDLFALNMNRAMNRIESGGWTVRTYQDTGRAVLSNDYLIIDNPEMLGLLNTVLETDGTPHRISTRSFVTVNNMSVDILFKDIYTGRGNGNDEFQLGVRIRNGEIGDWKGGIYPVIKRTSCDNSISVDSRELCFEFRHAGKHTLTTKRVLMKSKIAEVLPFSVNIVNALIEAEEAELPKFSDIVNGLGIKHGWSEAFTGSVFAGSEARYSLAGLVNGVTFAAHTQAPSPEAMVDAEFLGGALLFDTSGGLIAEAQAIHNSRTAREAAKEVRRNR